MSRAIQSGPLQRAVHLADEWMKPGDIILCKHEAEPRETFEHPTENKISKEIQRLQDGAANRVSSLLEL